MFGGAGISLRQEGGNSKDSSGARRRREVSRGTVGQGPPRTCWVQAMGPRAGLQQEGAYEVESRGSSGMMDREEVVTGQRSELCQRMCTLRSV